MGPLTGGCFFRPWYHRCMNPFSTNTRRSLLLGLSAFCLLNLTACQTTSIDATRDGRSTWRADGLELTPGGGCIHVNVNCASNDPITVVLLSEDLLEKAEVAETAHAGTSFAAASGYTRNGMFLVRFLELPISEYMVIAFVDVDGDGRLVEEASFIDSPTKFIEPHSRLMRFEIDNGATVNVTLDLEITGDHESHDS